MFFIGIDLGTSATKILLMDEQGAVEKVVSRSYTVEFPHPGWSEQDPGVWWRSVCDGLDELLCGIDRSEIRGVACTGQMHGLVALDSDGSVIRPAILWNDGRSAQEAERLNETFGEEGLKARTGNIAFAGFTAPKLLWMRTHEPNQFARIRHVLLPKDYIVYRLTDCFSTDVNDASGTLLFDVANRCWSQRMIDHCGAKGTWLPEVHESHESVGMLTPAISMRFGLASDVVVAAGAGDNAAAAIACGAINANGCNISVGTSGTVLIPTRSYYSSVPGSLHQFAHADGGYHIMGCILSAASCSEWFVGDVLRTGNFDAEEAGLLDRVPTKESPFFLPYLTGERSPHNDPNAKGAFVGLSRSTSRSEMVYAVREGVAFAIRDCFEVAREQGIDISASTLCGGGSRSALMRQLLADVLDVDICLPAVDEGPAFGAAMLAGVAAGLWPSVDDCVNDTFKLKGRVESRRDCVAALEERYRAWRSLYPSLFDFYQAN